MLVHTISEKNATNMCRTPLYWAKDRHTGTFSSRGVPPSFNVTISMLVSCSKSCGKFQCSRRAREWWLPRKQIKCIELNISSRRSASQYPTTAHQFFQQRRVVKEMETES